MRTYYQAHQQLLALEPSFANHRSRKLRFFLKFIINSFYEVINSSVSKSTAYRLLSADLSGSPAKNRRHEIEN